MHNESFLSMSFRHFLLNQYNNVLIEKKRFNYINLIILITQ